MPTPKANIPRTHSTLVQGFTQTTLLDRTTRGAGQYYITGYDGFYEGFTQTTLLDRTTRGAGQYYITGFYEGFTQTTLLSG